MLKEERKFLAGLFTGIGTNTGAYAILELANTSKLNEFSIILTALFLGIAYFIWKS